MNFRFEFLTLTQLGELFGVSNQQVGKWLCDLGLRLDTNKPSRSAFEGGFVTQSPSRGAGYNWAWHAEKTVAALRSAAHELVPSLPLGLVEPPELFGSFGVKRCGDVYGVMNGDGDVCLVASSQHVAELTAKVLGAANKHGVLDRLAERQAAEAK